jgi:hypothetical protein
VIRSERGTCHRYLTSRVTFGYSSCFHQRWHGDVDTGFIVGSKFTERFQLTIPRTIQGILRLHDFIATVNERISLVLSPESANSLLSTIYDETLTELNVSSDSERAMDDLNALLLRLGISVAEINLEGRTLIELQCPWASTTHPRIQKTSHQICPMAALVLAAQGRKDKSVRMKRMTLTRTGSQIETVKS